MAQSAHLQLNVGRKRCFRCLCRTPCDCWLTVSGVRAWAGTGTRQVHYDEVEAAKYTKRSRNVKVQRTITERAIELLNFPAGERKLVLDIGCGSGLSGGTCQHRASPVLIGLCAVLLFVCLPTC